MIEITTALPRPLPFLPVLLGLLWGGPVRADDEPPIQVPDPKEWSIREYRFPPVHLRSLQSDDADPFGKVQSHPQIPGELADADEIRRFIAQSNAFLLRGFSAAGVSFPDGTLMVADPATGTVAVRTNTYGHFDLQLLHDLHHQSLPATLQLQLELVAAPSPIVAEIIGKDSSQSNQARLLTELLAHQDAESISSSQIETKSGQTAMSTVRSAPDSATYPNGLRFQIDPMLSRDNHTVRLQLEIDYDQASAAASDGSTTRLRTAFRMVSDDTRLAGSWPGSTPSSTISAWITCRVQRLQSPESPLPHQWLSRHGEDVLPMPQKTLSAAHENEGFITTQFAVPPGIMSLGITQDDRSSGPLRRSVNSQANEGFSFATNAKRLLEEQGIRFPEGSLVALDPSTDTLHLRSHQEAVDLTDAFLSSIHDTPPTNLRFILSAIEMDEEAVAALENERGKPVPPPHGDLLYRQALETHSGQIGVIETRRIFSPNTPDEGQLTFTWVVDPVLGADAEHLDVTVSLSHESAPGKDDRTPVNASQLSTATTLRVGEPRVIGILTPKDPEVRQLVWLESQVVLNR